MKSSCTFAAAVIFAARALFVNESLAGESKLTGAEILDLVGDRSLFAGEAGAFEHIFHERGVTFYLEIGTYSQGEWFVEGDQFCSRWPPDPSEACYDVVRGAMP